MKKFILAIAAVLTLLTLPSMAAFAEPIMNIKTSFGMSSLNGDAWAQSAISRFSYNFRDAGKITAYASSVDNRYAYIMFAAKYSGHTEYYGLRDDNTSLALAWKKFDTYKEMRNYCEGAGK